MTIATYGIIGITALVSYVALQNRELSARLCHYPWAEAHREEYTRLLTGAVVHGSLGHLAINMFVLWSFGSFLEAQLISDGLIGFGPGLGSAVFVLLYGATAVLANLITFAQHRDNTAFRSVGASGSVSGITFCYALLVPWSDIYLLFIPIGIPAIVFALLFLAYSQYAARRGGDNIDHVAHFYGAVAMPLLLIALRPEVAPHFVRALTQNGPF